MPKNDNLSIHIRKLRKEKKIKMKESRTKKIIKQKEKSIKYKTNIIEKIKKEFVFYLIKEKRTRF